MGQTQRGNLVATSGERSAEAINFRPFRYDTRRASVVATVRCYFVTRPGRVGHGTDDDGAAAPPALGHRASSGRFSPPTGCVGGGRIVFGLLTRGRSAAGRGTNNDGQTRQPCRKLRTVPGKPRVYVLCYRGRIRRCTIENPRSDRGRGGSAAGRSPPPPHKYGTTAARDGGSF